MYRMLAAAIVAMTAAGTCQAYGASGTESFTGPYSSAMDNRNPRAKDAAIPGFVGPSGRGVCPPGANDEQSVYDPDGNFINPVFKAWATDYRDYIPAPAAEPNFIGNEQYYMFGGVPPIWRKPMNALGPVTGDNHKVCVLGDLWQWQLDVLSPDNPAYAANRALPDDDPYKIQPGHITLTFDMPIQNGPGPDFAVFENGHIVSGGDGVAEVVFAELAYVEVSTDGVVFVRFPNVSLTEASDVDYGTIDPSGVYNLAGKHVNAHQRSWSTPFNLSDLKDTAEVLSGQVDLENINYIRIVDIPGSGFFKDTAASLIDPTTIDPATGLGGTPYGQNHPIYDAWVTWGSGGFDLEAVGVIDQIYGDANSDGRVDLHDFYRLAAHWYSYGNWPQGDFDENGYVDENDLLLLADNWLYRVERYPE